MAGNEQRRCTPCAANTFQRLRAHTDTSCQLRMDVTCGPGHGWSTKANGSRCSACTQGTYQDARKHTQPCIAVTACANGEARVGHTSMQPGVCSLCAPGSFRLEEDEQEQCRDCLVEGRPCPAGSYQTGCQGNSSGRCEACPANTTQSSDNYRGRQCILSAFCQPGTGVNMLSQQPVCTACTVGEHSPSFPHAQPCKPHTFCQAGQYQSTPPNSTGDRTCALCPLGMLVV